MSKVPKSVLQDKFESGNKPKQRDFFDWMDSYHHKDESIPMTNIGGLSSALDGKLDRGAESTMLEEFDKRIQKAEDIVTKAYLGIATTNSTAPNIGAFWFKVEDGNVTTFTNLKNDQGVAISTVPSDFKDAAGAYDVTIEVNNGVALKKRDVKVLPDYNANTLDPASISKAETGKSVSEYFEKKRAENYDDKTDLAHFKDDGDKLYGRVDQYGNWDIELTEAKKKEIDPTDTVETANNYLFAILDNDGKLIPVVGADGKVITEGGGDVSAFFEFPIDREKGILDIDSLKQLSGFVLNDTAVGRRSTTLVDDAPRVPLTNDGYTHPSVVHVPSGWNGFNYWMAITPTFGKIAQLTDTAAYENPHIFCSNDGKEWHVPVGLTNPLDIPDAKDVIGHSGSYWSDTHLTLGSDGYMHVYYRGNNMSLEALNTSSGTHLRAVVHRKSKDGVNWSEKELIYSTDTNGVDSGSGLMAPAMLNCGNHWEIYDVVTSTASHPYTSKNSGRPVVRRFGTSPTQFGDYSSENAVNFTSQPWGDKSVWHLDGCKINGCYFLLLAIGNNGQDLADSLWLAYSGDGWNFDVVPTALFTDSTYRSCMIPKSSTDGKLTLWIYRANRISGEISLHELKLNYK